MSGIKILKYLLMKEAAKESVSSSGMTIIDKALRKQVERKVGKWVKSAQRQGSDIDKMSEQEIKYLIELNKPKPPKVISPGDPEHAGITEALLGGLRKTPLPKKSADVFDLTGKKIDTSKPILGGKNVELTHKDKIDWLVKNVDPNAKQTIPPKETLEQMVKDGRGDLIDHFYEMHTKNLGKPDINIDTSGLKHPGLVKKIITDEKLKPTEVTYSITDHIEYIKTLEPMEAMKEANKVLKGEGRYKGLSKADQETIVNDETVTDHIFERDIPEDPEFAQGGRVGYAQGSGELEDLLQRLGMVVDGVGIYSDYNQTQRKQMQRSLTSQINVLLR